MFELIGTVLTGGATGVIGSVIGKAFSFVDAWQEEKKAEKDHGRTIEMLRLQNEIGAEEMKEKWQWQKQTQMLICEWRLTNTTLWLVQVLSGSLICYVLCVLFLLLVSLF